MADYLKQFNTTAEYNTYINGTPDLPNVSLTLDNNEVHYNKKPDYAKEYLTFVALESGTFTLTVPANVTSTYMTSVSYSTDDGANWTTTTIDNTLQTITTPTINAGDKVLWKGEGKQMYGSNFSSTGNFNVSGNIMSMLYGDNFENQTFFPSTSTYPYVSDSNFKRLFLNCTKVISANNLKLPATTLTSDCYWEMFYGCTSLTTSPELPATTIGTRCYNDMFKNCTSLITAPTILPATIFKGYCYNGMFQGCTALTTAPIILGNSFASYSSYSCASMFAGCTALTTAPDLPATTLASGCYQSMFSGCSSLNSITMLATDISASGCLNSWVNGVAATGTFTKAASMTTLPTGASGIPENWTVIDA